MSTVKEINAQYIATYNTTLTGSTAYKLLATVNNEISTAESAIATDTAAAEKAYQAGKAGDVLKYEKDALDQREKIRRAQEILAGIDQQHLVPEEDNTAFLASYTAAINEPVETIKASVVTGLQTALAALEELQEADDDVADFYREIAATNGGINSASPTINIYKGVADKIEAALYYCQG